MNGQTDIQAQVTAAISGIYTSYVQAKPWITSQRDRDVRNPEYTRQILDQLGSPDKRGYNVAVTGSKGKGTHAILLAALLQRMGLRVGLFTSPHQVDFLERFRIDGLRMSSEDFLQYIGQVQTVASHVILAERQYLGPVGLLAATAALWFQHKQTDVNIYELGRGALHDDVNQIRHQGAVVTPVFGEHLALLGPTEKEVYQEKAGIVTAESEWLVSHLQTKEMSHVLKHAAGLRPLYAIEDDFHYDVVSTTSGQCTVHVEWNDGRSTIEIDQNLAPFSDNVAVACRAAYEVWKIFNHGRACPQHVSLLGLWLPGRMDVYAGKPRVLLDGTVHRDGAKRVAQWLNSSASGAAKYQAIFSLPADKDGRGVIDVLKPYLSRVVFTKANNRHLTFTDDVMEYAKSCGLQATSVENISEAYAQLQKGQQQSAGLLLLGTQSFVGDVLSYLQVDTSSLWKQ